jgi:tetratricopeptide (TPR) repeat protein
LEREREPQKSISGEARTKFINPPPLTAPNYFQDRFVETKLIADFLADDSRRLLTVVGRGGVGKTAMVCRLLKALEHGHLPDDLGDLAVDGIIYLSAAGTRRVNVPNLFADLLELLPESTTGHLEALYKDPHAGAGAKMSALLAAFPAGRVVLLLDNFEDVIDSETLALRDAELDEALAALLTLPPHAIKVIITTRIAPRPLLLVQPARQMRLDLDEGLESPFAENILRAMDVDGKVGLKTAPPEWLDEARRRTRGFPRGLEALFAILSADRDTTLADLLRDTAKLLPDNVVEALVGEAFSRLDPAAQKVMQALAIYARPVTPTAVDYLLQPYWSGVNSGPVLSRLVNMQFVRKETGRYYLHPVDRDYALSRVPRGAAADREVMDAAPPFTQIALADRGADYFKETRLPRENWKTLADLAPQLAEIDLRCAAEDFDTAARVLQAIDFDYLLLWGHYRLMIELHENLQGKLTDPDLKRRSVGNLGTAYRNIGQVQRAISCYEQALAMSREQKNRWGEGAWLGNLGLCYSDLGQTRRAIEYLEQALAIAREIGDRRGEGVDLSNLAEELIEEGRFSEAIKLAQESAKIKDEIGQPASYGYGRVALANFYFGNLPAAREAAETARRHDVPENNHNVLALLGVIALRQADRPAAQEAFAAVVQQAEQMLAHSAQNYAALDAKGLALSGLALCEGPQHVAVETFRRNVSTFLGGIVSTFRAARAINKDAGIVKRVLRLFDKLAKADAAGILQEVRAAAAGES